MKFYSKQPYNPEHLLMSHVTSLTRFDKTTLHYPL